MSSFCVECAIIPHWYDTTTTSVFSATRAYTLTNLANYAWYTVTVSGMLDSTALFSDTVMVMPTDLATYLPLVLRQD